MRVADLMGLVRALSDYEGVKLLAENHGQSAYPTFVMHGTWEEAPVQFVYVKAHTNPTKSQAQNIKRLVDSGCHVHVWNATTKVETIVEHIKQGGSRGQD